jgi:hypothetical protein
LDEIHLSRDFLRYLQLERFYSPNEGVLMKSILTLALVLFSAAAFAGALKTNEVVLTEVQMQQVSSCIPESGNPCSGNDTELSAVSVGYTKMFVTSEIDMNFQIQTTETTHWKPGAQLLDVKGVTLQYGAQSGRGAKVTIYQVDGNNMGSIQTNLTMNCSKEVDAIRCSATLMNQNKVFLTIGR